MKVGDQWEALFRIWHERAHDAPELLKDLRALERRIVKLEAFIGAVRNERRLLRHGGEDLGPGGL